MSLASFLDNAFLDVPFPEIIDGEQDRHIDRGIIRELSNDVTAYHLRYRPHFLEDLCDIIDEHPFFQDIPPPNLAEDTFRTLANLLSINSIPQSDRIIESLEIWADVLTGVLKAAMPEYMAGEAWVDSHFVDSGVLCSTFNYVAKDVIGFKLKGTKVMNKVSDEIAEISKRNGGDGSAFLQAFEGGNLTALELILISIGTITSKRNLHYGLLFSGTSFMFFQRVVHPPLAEHLNEPMFYFLCSDRYPVKGQKFLKALTAMYLDKPLPLLCNHPVIPPRINPLSISSGQSQRVSFSLFAYRTEGILKGKLAIIFGCSPVYRQVYQMKRLYSIAHSGEDVIVLEKIIGVGGVGVVYQANGGTVAVKYYHGRPKSEKSDASTSSWLNIDYFSREAEIYDRLEELQGDCIPKIFGSYTLQGVSRPFGIIVMEKLLPDGFTYTNETILQAPLERRVKVLQALKKLHERGFCHGDVSARNLYLGPDKTYLIDFSHSRRATEQDKRSEFRSICRYLGVKLEENLEEEISFCSYSPLFSLHSRSSLSPSPSQCSST